MSHTTSYDGAPVATSRATPDTSSNSYHTSTSSSRARLRKHEISGTALPPLQKSTPGLSTTAPDVQLRRRQTRLPWLDGNQGRHHSVPKLPGSFVDDDAMLPEPLRASTSVRVGADATMSPVPMPVDQRNVSFASVGDALPPKSDVPAKAVSRQLSPTTVQQIAARAMQAPVYSPVQSKPAIPLVTPVSYTHLTLPTKRIV